MFPTVKAATPVALTGSNEKIFPLTFENFPALYARLRSHYSFPSRSVPKESVIKDFAAVYPEQFANVLLKYYEEIFSQTPQEFFSEISKFSTLGQALANILTDSKGPLKQIILKHYKLAFEQLSPTQDIEQAHLLRSGVFWIIHLLLYPHPRGLSPEHAERMQRELQDVETSVYIRLIFLCYARNNKNNAMIEMILKSEAVKHLSPKSKGTLYVEFFENNHLDLCKQLAQSLSAAEVYALLALFFVPNKQNVQNKNVFQQFYQDIRSKPDEYARRGIEHWQYFLTLAEQHPEAAVRFLDDVKKHHGLSQSLFTEEPFAGAINQILQTLETRALPAESRAVLAAVFNTYQPVATGISARVTALGAEILARAASSAGSVAQVTASSADALRRVASRIC